MSAALPLSPLPAGAPELGGGVSPFTRASRVGPKCPGEGSWGGGTTWLSYGQIASLGEGLVFCSGHLTQFDPVSSKAKASHS